MSEPKILKTKKERLAYIEKVVKRNNKAKLKIEKDAKQAMKYTEADETGY